MRSVRRSDRGLSEIVGTLMLVLIVVSAATLLAAFVATYQAQLQKEQSFSHDQSLESIHILSLATKTNAAGTNFSSFGFTIGSEYVNPSFIVAITINNEPLKNFSWMNYDTGATGWYEEGRDLNLSPFEEVKITTNLSASSPAYSFFNGSVPMPNEYLKFDIYTYLQNDFSRVFLPPVPLEQVSLVNLTGSSTILLDGSTAFQPGTNATLIQWNWTITRGTTSPTNLTPFHLGPFYGEEAEFPASDLIAGQAYNVTLALTNSDGLVATTLTQYTVP
jgi:flagellin-like protein